MRAEALTMTAHRRAGVRRAYAESVRLFEMARALNGTVSANTTRSTLADAARELARAVSLATEASGEPAEIASAWEELCGRKRRFAVLRTLSPANVDRSVYAGTAPEDPLLLRRFQEVLLDARRWLNGRRHGVPWSGRRPRIRAWTAAAIAIIALVLAPGAGLVFWHRHAAPMTPAATGGQVFWSGGAREILSQERSVRFQVIVDGMPHVYQVDLPDPVRIAVLRLDPVNDRAINRVALARVTLLGSDGAVLWTWTPGSDAGWQCENCDIDSISDEAMRVATGRMDPYLVIAPDYPGQTGVGTVEIAMSAWSERIPFWRWLLRIRR